MSGTFYHDDNPKGGKGPMYVVIAVIIIIVIFAFAGNSNNQQQNTANTTLSKEFYTQSISNIRSCDSLTCDVIGKCPANAVFTLSYAKINDLPDWIYVTSCPDANGKTVVGYMNKADLRENEVQTTNTQQSQTQDHPQQQPLPQPQQKNLPSIIAKWSPAVAFITCSFSNGDVDFGSGFLIKNSVGQIEIITNKHVLTYDTPDNGATSCAVHIPGDGDNVYTAYNTGTVDNNPIGVGVNNFDWGYIVITDGDAYFNNIASENLPICQQQEQTGDNVVVLGYPDYAGQFINPTATQGIISGYADPYYTTSAQIESGNSGGVAIDPDKNCYIGIPSAVQMGNYANLGRILNANVVFALPY